VSRATWSSWKVDFVNDPELFFGQGPAVVFCHEKWSKTWIFWVGKWVLKPGLKPGFV
jgi:hypothetical protein